VSGERLYRDVVPLVSASLHGLRNRLNDQALGPVDKPAVAALDAPDRGSPAIRGEREPTGLDTPAALWGFLGVGCSEMWFNRRHHNLIEQKLIERSNIWRGQEVLRKKYWELQKQAGIGERDIHLLSDYYTGLRRIIFRIPDGELRCRLITTHRQLEKLAIDHAGADHSVTLAELDAEDSKQFHTIVAMLVGVAMVYTGWLWGNDIGLSLVGAISGGVCAIILTIDKMRDFDRQKLKRIAQLQQNIKSRLECAEQLASGSEIFSSQEASTGEEEKSISETQTSSWIDELEEP
jgi:hypothetical protein